MRPLKERHEAIKLRKQGKTYNEIREILGPIPKGTLSGWFKNIQLTAEQKKAIEKRIKDGGELGREKAAWANRNKRLMRIKRIKEEALQDWKDLNNHPLFIGGLLLYLAEGSKKNESFQFMNSDPNLIKLMMRWLSLTADVNHEDYQVRLYIHRPYADENLEKFWAKTLSLTFNQFAKTVYKPTPHNIKRNPKYKGCLRLTVKGRPSELYWRVMAWRDALYNTL